MHKGDTKSSNTASLQQNFEIKKTHSFLSIMSHKKANANSLPRQKTVHSGWLWKKGLMKSPLANRRWFEIKGDQLYYFKSKGDTTPLGQIPLAGNEVKRIQSSDTNNKYSFQLVAGQERKGRPVTENFDTLLFAASTPYELDEWIRAINRVIYTYCFQPLGGGMFGRSIRETMNIESRRGAGMVPIIVELCVEYIKKHGLHEEGIFRIPGAQEEVDALKNKFNTGSLKELKDGEYKVHIVASVLKKYLGDLPQSVIPPDNYDQFIAVGGLFKEDSDEAMKKFAPVLKDIPKAHFDLLKYLCRFLYELKEYHNETKMTVENLALVFGPNILRPQNEDPAMLLQCLSEANTTTVALINNQANLFPVTNDECYYDPNRTLLNDHRMNDLIDFDSEQRSATFDYHKCKSIPTLAVNGELKRSLSESSLHDIVIENERTKSLSGSPSSMEEAASLRQEMVDMKLDYEEQISDLEKRLGEEKQVQKLLKIRLVDEQKARQALEERLELYRAGIEEYCRKFGHVDISIR
ncbi:rho GTPase-activating protein 24-like isoform X1 [Clytia hemisphaerica]|uniref:rho GTPase-activating protein 24-like isoform X1 n=1 Tax=Clytia hemisphaerica TaxID=252671 RepID=UPI0034D5CE40